MLWSCTCSHSKILVSQHLELPFFSAQLRLRTFYVVEVAMYGSFLDYQDLLFRADFSDPGIDPHADEVRLLERAWEHVEARLVLPKYHKFKKFANALYCGCKLAIHHRVTIEIVYYYSSDSLSISLQDQSLQFYDSKLMASMCSDAKLISSSYNSSSQKVHLDITFFD